MMKREASFCLLLSILLLLCSRSASFANDPDCKVFAVALLDSSGIPFYAKADLKTGDYKKYHLHENKKHRLGGGAYGDVYLGEKLATGSEPSRTVVFKQYHKLNREKMMREIMISQDVCGGDNIAKLLDVIQFPDSKYPTLVLEYVHGESRKTLYPRLSPEDVRLYAYEFLRALNFAHDRHIMHNDIKPANLMIDSSQHLAKLIDWGLSKYYAPDHKNRAIGTMNYKSPEMLSGYTHFNQSTDIWSFGCIFAEWIFRLDEPIFLGSRHKNQLNEIAKVLGTHDLKKYFKKYGMSDADLHSALTDLHHKKRHKSSQVFSDVLSLFKPTPSYPKQPLEAFRNKHNKKHATDQAVDLLNRIFIYDHAKRITAGAALAHSYFDPIREQQAALKALNQSVIFPPA